MSTSNSRSTKKKALNEANKSVKTYGTSNEKERDGVKIIILHIRMELYYQSAKKVMTIYLLSNISKFRNLKTWLIRKIPRKTILLEG